MGFIGRLETDGAPVLEEAFVRVKLGVESGTRQRKRSIVPHLLQTTRFSVICFCLWRAHNFCRMPSMTTCIITH